MPRILIKPYYRKMKLRNIKMIVPMLLLPLFAGCSDSSGDEFGEPAGIPAGVINEVVMYEANPKVFAATEALNAVTARLDEIKALGTNVLWLMPIFEQGVKDAIGSPYCVKDYQKVNNEFGTLDDLKTLVKRAHEKDMRVILDWVANHTSWDNAWIADKSWYTQDANGNIVSPEGMGWPDVADLNFDNADMRKAMIDAMKYWVTEADVDGYRCDHAEGVPDDFWAQAISELKALKGDRLLMLAEGSATSLFNAGFDMVYGWSFASKLQDVFAGNASLSSLYDVHRQEYQGVTAGKQRLRYSTNHDLASERSPLQAYKNARGAMAAYVIAATLGGTPLIYSSQEIGYPQALSFFNYQPMDWNSNSSYLNEYKKLMELYRTHSILRSAGIKTYDTGKAATVYRASGDEAVLIVVNTSNEAETIKVPIERVGDRVKNLMDNEVMTLPVSLTLEPYQYYIWKKE